MFHLVSVLWDLLRHHRWRFLSGLGLAVFMGVSLQSGMTTLNASLTRQYSSVTSQQVSLSAHDKMLARRRARMQKLLLKTPLKAAAGEEFPPFLYAVPPVSKVPDWGDMHSPAEWNRTYEQMTAGDFVPLPAYDPDAFTIPMISLISPETSATAPLVTAKLVFSTRFLASYDIDAAEYSGTHAGIDIKLALGTPVGAIGGGRVVQVVQDDRLGLHVVVEHHVPGEGTFFSIYGHFGSVAVKEGQDVRPGDTLGYVGMTGETTAPHLHLQIDKGKTGETHAPYFTQYPLSADEVSPYMVDPMPFITAHETQQVAEKSGL